ncbi:hypothetical protein pEaSNUABM5_00221 [Erwinia phage pEa_SNUABM_5]|uniref:Uncharacterized protein n=1 Tax=Erwinia phage pEa_SNUABM_5 TaxID=2797313 RepID=A0A7T8IVY1_9CAUD|nr:hypothetical protein MPK73_gp221 [Erwinia phage pEa_SNUABM_5]QQO90363.1 hypothetical protein pEaSNUABM5_00221 [Erwinia phage pEa_SNUABM_5]
MIDIQLNPVQQSLLTIIQTAQQRAFENVQRSAYHHVDERLNGDREFQAAIGKLSYAELDGTRVRPTPDQIDEVVASMEISFETMRDFHTLGFHLPQRSGATVFAQYLLMDFMEKYPGAKCLYIGTREPDLFCVTNPDVNCDAFEIHDSAGYGRMCKQLKESREPQPLSMFDPVTFKQSDPYSLIVFDNANYLRGRDVRFEQLLRAVHNPRVRPVQFLIHFAS